MRHPNQKNHYWFRPQRSHVVEAIGIFSGLAAFIFGRSSSRTSCRVFDPSWSSSELKKKKLFQVIQFSHKKFRDNIVSWLNVHSNFYCQVNSISVSCSRVNNNAIAGWWFTAYHINLVQLCKVGLWIHNCMWCRFYLFHFATKTNAILNWHD